MFKVLFVCLGNICRSPMAEGIFNRLIIEKKLTSKLCCDSAGTSNYHIGELPDQRMRHTAKVHGIELTHKARQIAGTDFEEFDYIIAMDESNRATIMSHTLWKDTFKDKLSLMLSYGQFLQTLNVPDPYFGGQEGFEEVYQMLVKANNRLLHYLIAKHQL